MRKGNKITLLLHSKSDIKNNNLFSFIKFLYKQKKKKNWFQLHNGINLPKLYLNQWKGVLKSTKHEEKKNQNLFQK